MISSIPKGEKLKILDNGTGVGLFTDQIRRIFGEEVEVYSTGLSKKAAKEYRKLGKLPPLNKDDLKWRSIQELSDYPEFHLIIDTYGEQYYRPKNIKSVSDYNIFKSNEKSEDERNKEAEEEWLQHIYQVYRKLLPGGYASIGPIHFSTNFKKEEMIRELKAIYNIDATWGLNDSECLKIEKPL